MVFFPIRNLQFRKKRNTLKMRKKKSGMLPRARAVQPPPPDSPDSPRSSPSHSPPDSSRYSPDSPIYNPRSPSHSPPDSPRYSPTSPNWSPSHSPPDKVYHATAPLNGTCVETAEAMQDSDMVGCCDRPDIFHRNHDWADLNNILRFYNRQIILTDQFDGCLFRAIAYSLYAKSGMHRKVRNLVNLELRNNFEDYIYNKEDWSYPAVRNKCSWDDFATRMELDGESGGVTVLQAAANALDTIIYVVSTGTPDKTGVIQIAPDNQTMREKSQSYPFKAPASSSFPRRNEATDQWVPPPEHGTVPGDYGTEYKFAGKDTTVPKKTFLVLGYLGQSQYGPTTELICTDKMTEEKKKEYETEMMIHLNAIKETEIKPEIYKEFGSDVRTLFTWNSNQMDDLSSCKEDKMYGLLGFTCGSFWETMGTMCTVRHQTSLLNRMTDKDAIGLNRGVDKQIKAHALVDMHDIPSTVLAANMDLYLSISALRRDYDMAPSGYPPCDPRTYTDPKCGRKEMGTINNRQFQAICNRALSLFDSNDRIIETSQQTESQKVQTEQKCFLSSCKKSATTTWVWSRKNAEHNSQAVGVAWTTEYQTAVRKSADFKVCDKCNVASYCCTTCFEKDKDEHASHCRQHQSWRERMDNTLLKLQKTETYEVTFMCYQINVRYWITVAKPDVDMSKIIDITSVVEVQGTEILSRNICNYIDSIFSIGDQRKLLRVLATRRCVVMCPSRFTNPGAFRDGSHYTGVANYEEYDYLWLMRSLQRIWRPRNRLHTTSDSVGFGLGFLLPCISSVPALPPSCFRRDMPSRDVIPRCQPVEDSPVDDYTRPSAGGKFGREFIKRITKCWIFYRSFHGIQ